VKSLLEQAEKTGDDASQAREDLVLRIKETLLPHAKAEEKTFYKRLQKADEEGEELVDEAIDEHQEAEVLLRELENTEPTSEVWMTTLKKLKDSVLHHIEEEESNVFDKAGDTLTQQELEEVLVEYQETREMVLTQAI
jgi:hemerythrin superfamily protein